MMINPPVMLMTKRLLTLVTLAICTHAAAQSSGGGFEISRYTIDNGGGRASSEEYTLTGTIGQLGANKTPSVSYSYILSDGFWAREFDRIFSDGFERAEGVAENIEKNHHATSGFTLMNTSTGGRRP